MSSSGPTPLDVSGQEFAKLLDLTAAFLAAELDSLAGRRVLEAGGPGAPSPELRGPPPEQGRPIGRVLSLIDEAARAGINTASGAFLAYIPAGGLASTAIADLISNVLNRYTSIGAAAPGLVTLEEELLDWMCRLMDLPDGSAGLMTSGASLATVSALAAARDAHALTDLSRARLYVTDLTHHVVAKAARLVGFPRAAVHTLACDADRKLDVGALRAAIEADRASGLTPFCVVATAGSTHTGGVDPLPEIADLAGEARLWLHVDAAYGGFFQLTERGRAKLRGIGRADSIVLNPHKGLFLPHGTGCLLVRREEDLLRAHRGDEGKYMRDRQYGDAPDFCERGPELTRPFRGLRVWLPLQLHGVGAFRRALDAKLDLARAAFAALREIDGVEVQAPPDLSVVTFRIVAAGLDAGTATDACVRWINERGRVMLSTTSVDGETLGRLAILSHRTTAEHVAIAIEEIRGWLRISGSSHPHPPR